MAAFFSARAAGAEPPPRERVSLRAATFTPLYSPEGTGATVAIAAFQLDAKPVTQGEFRDFLREQPRWQRTNAPRIFRDEHYLRDWAGDLEPGSPEALQRPAVQVSWFAARAFCRAHGGRLPTQAEWEYAALAGDHGPDMRQEPAVREGIMRWYVTPADEDLAPVGARPPNYWGLYDMHSLIWEWVDDFNTNITTGDNRGDGDSERNLFCGASAGLSTDRADYAAYMRFALRSSLTPAYTGRNLGFRCAYDGTGE